jgi:hypothetical protein
MPDDGVGEVLLLGGFCGVADAGVAVMEDTSGEELYATLLAALRAAPCPNTSSSSGGTAP